MSLFAHPFYLVKFFRCQLESDRPEVIAHSDLFVGRSDGDDVLINTPAQKNLPWRNIVLSSQRV